MSIVFARLLFDYTAAGDLDDAVGLTRGRAKLFNGFDDVEALGDLAKDDVLAVEPRGGDGGDKKLGPVGVASGVGHREKAWAGVFYLEVLIGECGAVDRLAACAVVVSEVAALQHEVRDDPVER